MEGIYVFLLRWDIPIFFIATISLLVALVRLMQARYVMQRAMFTLERDFAKERRASGFALLFTALIAISILWYVNQVVAPKLSPELLFLPTVTPDPLETPFASPSPMAPTEAPVQRIDQQTPVFVATATLDPIISGITAEVPTPDDVIQTPTRSFTDAFIPEGGGCTPGVNINSPRPDTTQTGTLSFYGTATDRNFAFYGLEISGPGTGSEWINLLSGGNFEQVQNNLLGSVDLSQLENGRYEVRLSVFADGAEPIARCQIGIFITLGEDGNPVEN
ncbi:MAG: hypothetical protein ACI9EW_001464 [Cellvibrionaceae bacterium]|jgi:hypothetical protein